MLGGVKLTENADPDKYFYSGYRIGFDSCSLFPYSNFNWDKKFVIFGVDNSSSVHIDIKKKDILILGEVSTQRLDDTTITAEATYSINLSRLQRKFCLRLDYNGNNKELNECVHDFTVDYCTFDISDITDINKYLMKKHSIN